MLSQNRRRSFRDVVIERLRKHAESGDRRSFDMTAQFNGIPKRDAQHLWDDCQRERKSQ